MIVAVADTHTIIWYLFGDPRLSQRARAIIDEATGAGKQVAVSTITLAEMIYLVEKSRIQPIVLERLIEILQGEEVLVEVPFDRTIAQAMRKVRWSEVPDLPDRIIAASAVYLDVPVISRDNRIQVSSVETIW